MKIKTQQEFIIDARLVHGYRYGYDKVIYINSYTGVEIYCPTHGYFFQNPRNHLNGANCPLCGKTSKKTLDKFLEQAFAIHGDTFGYGNFVYQDTHTKGLITCKIHGDFLQTPNKHIIRRHGCPLCNPSLKKDTASFTSRALAVYGKNRYNYDKTVYVNIITNVTITCLKHGDFTQNPHNHLKGHEGCPMCECGDTADFILRAILVHGNFYDYSELVYKSMSDKVRIICPKHGPFNQSASGHLEGHNCPTCRMSKGELKVRKILESAGISFSTQHKFDSCKFIRSLKFDFVVWHKGRVCAIEFNGAQHYHPVSFGRSVTPASSFEAIQIRDAMVCRKRR